MSALIRRAEHDQARAVADHDFVPEPRILVRERTDDKAAHAMGEETDRPLGIFALIAELAQKSFQPVRESVER